MNPTPATEPNPGIVWDAINAYQKTAAFRAAVDLELFTAIAEGATTSAQLAVRCGASERGMRILCDFLTVHGFLLKSGDAYQLTLDASVFLNKRSPAYMGGILQFINTPELLRAFDDLTEVVRKGSTSMAGAGVVDKDDPVWVDFAESMVPMIGQSAGFIGECAIAECPGPIRVLDIAAGHGMFGIEIAKRNPQAHITALDWTKVLEVASRNAKAAGVESRYELMPGDAFELNRTAEFDLVLLTNFLHHFERPTCETLLRKVRAALKPGGRAITLEFVPNEDRVSPPPSATFSMMMLGLTKGGDAYPFSELDGMFRAAGFGASRMLDVPRSPQRLVITARE
jgi:SAM-dependent methyltransferase